jgi:ABC-type multidrug transport system ATPase subunit
MRQRLGIAQALIAQPRLLIVDEPTAGLDPEERVRFHNLLGEVAEQNTIVLLSTHIVADVASICSALAILKAGRIVATGTPTQALHELKDSVWEAIVPRTRAGELRRSHAILSTQMVHGGVRMRIRSHAVQPAEEFVPVQPTLEDFYLSVMSAS